MITATVAADGKVNLVGKQGTTWSLPIELFQDDNNTIPFPLTNYLVRGHYRKDYNALSPILIEFLCTVVPLDAETNPDQNKIIVHATPEQSTTCKTLSGVYDIEIYNEGESLVERVLEGALTITPEVTK